MPLTDLAKRTEALEHRKAVLDQQLQERQAPLIEAINSHLREYEGQVFESLDIAVQHIKGIKHLVRSAGCRLFFKGHRVTLQCVAPRDSRPKIQVRAHVNGRRHVLYNAIKVPPLHAQPRS